MDPLVSHIARTVHAAMATAPLAIYVVGSHATGNVLPTSDMDLIVITAEPLDREPLQAFWHLRDRLRAEHGVDLDLSPRPWDRVRRGGIGIKREGVFLCGRDVRDQIEEPQLAELQRGAIDVAVRFITNLRKADAVSAASIEFPDPTDALRGYVRYDHRRRPLDPLLSLLFVATARVLMSGGPCVTNKHRLPVEYQRHVGGEHASFVDDLLHLGRDTWHYQVPVDPAGRARLAEMCEHALAFERDFLRLIEARREEP